MLNTNFDIKILYGFLDKVCQKSYDLSNNYYIFDNISYKKLEYYNMLNEFKIIIEPFYINSKKFYIQRELNYTKFLTIIRQICKFAKIHYYHKISYDKSKYFITYYIEIK